MRDSKHATEGFIGLWAGTDASHQASLSLLGGRVAKYPSWAVQLSSREWRLPLKENLGGRFQTPHPSATGAIVPSSDRKDKLEAFLKRLNEMPISTPFALGADTKAFGRRAWWLSYCYEETLDAMTLQDALKWHGRIVRELTRRIALVNRSDWPTVVKTGAIFELMHDRILYNRAILNIDQAMQREEDVDWQWW
jgi:hypothetical protein